MLDEELSTPGDIYKFFEDSLLREFLVFLNTELEQMHPTVDVTPRKQMGHSTEFLIFSSRKKFDLFKFFIMYLLCNKESIYQRILLF
jgi:hypothetical protein